MGPPIHLVFSVQEEFNLRGVIPIAQQLLPDIAIQLDLILAADTADMEDRGNVSLGKGPAISLYSFHGRGTLNGIIPHPALVKLFEKTASQNNIPLQRSAHIGALTDLSLDIRAGSFFRADVTTVKKSMPSFRSARALSIISFTFFN